MQTTSNVTAEPTDHEPHRDNTGQAHRFSPAALLKLALHYLEMLAVMAVGMLVLGSTMTLAATALGFGRADLEANAPALVLAGMAVSMTAPMVWWMNRRGHSWAANRAMAVSMIAPTVAAIALLASGALTDLDALLGIQHMAMFPAMAAAMLLHRSEYISHRHRLPHGSVRV